jgi:hypothetical protein
MEVVGICLPGVGEEAQRLVHLLQVDLDLLREQCRLICLPGFDARLCLGALGARGAEGAEPGQPDQDRGGGGDADEPRGLADAHPVHRVNLYGAIVRPGVVPAAQPATVSPG